MKRNTYGLLLIILCSILILTIKGCRDKEEVSIEPEVQLLDPAENSVYNIYDSIKVSLIVRHVSVIGKITISVTDEELKPILTGYATTVNKKETTINTYIEINNRYIEGDQHYLLIEVEDSKEIFKFWYSIHINPLESELEKVTFVSGNENINNLYILKFPESAEKVATWNSDYLGGAVDSRNFMFYSSGSLLEGIQGFNLIDNEFSWNIHGLPPLSMPYFTAFAHDDGKVLVATREGVVEGYDHTGQKIFTGEKLNNGKFTLLLKHEGFALGGFIPYTGTLKNITVFNYPAGNIYQTIELEGDPIAILTLDKNEIMVLVQVSGKVKAYVYVPSEKSFTYFHDVTDKNIKSVTGGNDNLFLLTNDEVLWYRPDIGSTVPYLSAEGISCIEYDPVNNLLFTGQDGKVKQYILPSLTEQVLHIGSEPVKDINLWYNK